MSESEMKAIAESALSKISGLDFSLYEIREATRGISYGQEVISVSLYRKDSPGFILITLNLPTGESNGS